MTQFALDFLSVTTPTAILTTLLFGGMIGAFYGYGQLHDAPLQYPLQFWFVGLVFVAILAGLGIAEEANVSVPLSLGRAVLWTFMCGAIPIGRWLRIMYHAWRIGRRK